MPKIWKNDIDLKFLHQLHKDTLVETLGIEVVEIGDDYFRMKMPVDHRTIQPLGLLHGGASVALAESAGSVASLLCLENVETHSVVGIEINANHLRSVRAGFVYSTTKPVRLGRTIQVWNTDIYDEEERLVCTSRLTVMIVKKR
jgi:1,4-dihydroxy-2-naphthoyl-CoA hydrolase